MRLLYVAALFIALICISVPAWAGDSVSGALMDVLHAKGILSDDQYSDLKKTSAEGGEQAAQKKLLDVLHGKGVLDDAQYKTLSEQADREAAKTQAVTTAAPAAPQGPAAPQAQAQAAPAAEAKPETAAAGGPERPVNGALTSLEEGFARISGDTVKLKISAFFQGGWLTDDAGFSYGAPPNNFFSPTAGNQFFVRRARLYFDFNVGPKVGMKLSLESAVDLNTSSSTSGGRSILRDAYVWTDYIPYTRITIGQFKTPFGLEGVEALGDNPTINRSMVTNLVHYPLLRDIGAMASWKLKTDVSGLPLGASWAVALVNGTGYNLADDNDRKDVVFRGTVTPLVPGLSVGGSLYHGQTHVTPSLSTTGQSSSTTPPYNKDHDSWAAEAEYLPPFLNGLKLRFEYLWNRQFYTKFYSLASVTGTAPNNPPGSIPVVPASGYTLNTFTGVRTVHTDGWYVLAAYRVDGFQGFWRYLNGFEPLVRYDAMNEDRSSWVFTDIFTKSGFPNINGIINAGNDHKRYRTTVGMNYYFNKYARLMVNYEMIHAAGGLKLASIEPVDLASHNLFTTLFQLKF